VVGEQPELALGTGETGLGECGLAQSGTGHGRGSPRRDRSQPRSAASSGSKAARPSCAPAPAARSGASIWA